MLGKGMMDKGMMGGCAAALVLSLLRQREMYGYEIIQELAARSENAFVMLEGTLYPLLHNLENAGHIVSRLQRVDNRTRRYYRITDSGVALLEDKLKQWEIVTGMLRALNGNTSLASALG